MFWWEVSGGLQITKCSANSGDTLVFMGWTTLTRTCGVEFLWYFIILFIKCICFISVWVCLERIFGGSVSCVCWDVFLCYLLYVLYEVELYGVLIFVNEVLSIISIIIKRVLRRMRSVCG